MWFLKFGFSFRDSDYELTGSFAPTAPTNSPAPVANGAAIPTSANPSAPQYQSQPYLCQLVFGPNRKHLISTAADLQAGVLHIDLNANGGLGDPGETFELTETSRYQETRYFTAVVPEVSVGEDTHVDLSVKYGQTGDQVKGVFSILLWGSSPSTTDADLVTLELPNDPNQPVPIVHFDGPLTMGNYRKIVEMPRGEEVNFYSLIGTPGSRGGTLTAIANTHIPQDAHPLAEFEFPHRDSTQPAIKVKTYLEVRC